MCQSEATTCIVFNYYGCFAAGLFRRGVACRAIRMHAPTQPPTLLADSVIHIFVCAIELYATEMRNTTSC